MTTRIVAITKISKRFQTTVPKEVRDTLDIGEKDKVLWSKEDGKVILRKA